MSYHDTRFILACILGVVGLILLLISGHLLDEGYRFGGVVCALFGIVGFVSGIIVAMGG